MMPYSIVVCAAETPHCSIKNVNKIGSKKYEIDPIILVEVVGKEIDKIILFHCFVSSFSYYKFSCLERENKELSYPIIKDRNCLLCCHNRFSIFRRKSCSRKYISNR